MKHIEDAEVCLTSEITLFDFDMLNEKGSLLESDLIAFKHFVP